MGKEGRDSDRCARQGTISCIRENSTSRETAMEKRSVKRQCHLRGGVPNGPQWVARQAKHWARCVRAGPNAHVLFWDRRLTALSSCFLSVFFFFPYVLLRLSARNWDNSIIGGSECFNFSINN